MNGTIHIIVVTLREVKCLNPRRDHRTRIVLEVAHEVGELVDVRKRCTCDRIDLLEEIIESHDVFLVKNVRTICVSAWIFCSWC